MCQSIFVCVGIAVSKQRIPIGYLSVTAVFVDTQSNCFICSLFKFWPRQIMGTGPYRRKKRNKGDHPIKEKYRTKRKTKDLDEIQDDLKPAKVTNYLALCVYL